MPILKPYIMSEYRNVYSPAPDVYRGIDTPSFKYGVHYDQWIANDFTIVKGSDSRWHAYGITHPKPPAFFDAFHHSGNVHEAEYQLFHCSHDGSLASLCQPDGPVFEEHEKVLYPQSRGMRPECWAPCMNERNGEYWLFWTPQYMRAAKTTDMFSFTVLDGFLFDGPSSLRDPYIFEEDGIYTMLYVHDHLYSRTSTDLIHWSEERVFQSRPFRGSQESPCFIKRHGMYYLFWSIYDGQNGCYDERTYVYASDRLDGFDALAPLTMVEGHAVEIISEDEQDYILSVFYPKNGLNIAKLGWK